MSYMDDVTKVLDDDDDDDPSDAEKLLPLIYDELRKLAAAKLAGERANHSLQATSLVHEAYMRLVNGAPDAQWDGRGHFFSAAAEAMRRILVDRARRKLSLKRGGDFKRKRYAEDSIIAPKIDGDLLDLDMALMDLEQQDVRKADLGQAALLRWFDIAGSCRHSGYQSSPPPIATGPTLVRGCFGKFRMTNRQGKIKNSDSVRDENAVATRVHFVTRFLNPTRQQGTGFLKLHPSLTSRVAVLTCPLINLSINCNLTF